MKNSFYLIIPSQRKNGEALRAYEKKAIDQWLLDLPVANAGLAMRMFYDFLEELNSLEASVSLRLEALEVLRPYFFGLKDVLRSRIVASGVPKSESVQKVFDLLVSIERNFTIGYFIVVRELTGKSVGWFQGKSATLAIHRVIKGLSAIIETYSVMFLPVPDWVWFDLHSLYAVSLKIKKQTTKIPDEFSVSGKGSTIEESYKQVLLLSLAEPSGLMPREVHQVYDFIESVSQFVELVDKPVANQKVQCVVLMDGDNKPYFCKKVGQDEMDVKYLDLNKLYNRFHQSEKYSSPEVARFSTFDFATKSSEKLSASLYEYLVKRWLGYKLQGSEVFPDRLDRYITIGLAATHSSLKMDEGDDEDEQNEKLEILAETTSASGLTCHFEKEGGLSIGSLISFRKNDKKKNTHPLAIVVKIALPKLNGQIRFEVKALTAQSHAIGYSKVNTDGSEAPNKALLYSSKGKSYILMDSYIHKDGDMLKMHRCDGDYEIILWERKNVGLGYWQFECRIMDEQQRNVSQSTSKKGYDFI